MDKNETPDQELIDACRNYARAILPDWATNENDAVPYMATQMGFIAGVKWQKERDCWIDVKDKDRLPPRAKLVLLSVGECKDPYIGALHHGGFQIWGLGRPEPVTDMKVTHWQPLPAASSDMDERSVATEAE